MERIERLEENVIKVRGEICLSDVYAQIEGKELVVEPLSAKKPLSRFIAEGGLGYNSLREGSFAGKVFKLKSSLFDESFTYGLDCLTLYNVGYPLFRILEGPLHPLSIKEFGAVSEITLPVRPRQPVKVYYSPEDVSQIQIPSLATNVLYLNNFAAQILDLRRSGILTTYPDRFAVRGKGELQNGIWSKRFLEDEIPVDHHRLRIFTLKSNLATIQQAYSEKTEGMFLALFNHLGVLVIMSGSKSAVERIWTSISQSPFTYRLKTWRGNP